MVGIMKAKKYRIILPGLLFLFSLTATCFAVENEDILRSSIEAQFEVNFEGIREEQIFSSRGRLDLKARVIYQKPDFMYIEYLEPPELKGKIIIDDGKRRIEYFSQKDKVKMFPSQHCAQIESRREKILQVLLTNFSISRLSEEKMLGREVYLLNLSPGESIGPSLRLWIDKKTHFILQREKYNPEGELLSFFRYVQAQFGKYIPREALLDNIPRIPSFEEKVPSFSYYGKEEIAGKVNFPVSFPEYTPAGYVFQGAEITEGEALKLIYTNGLEFVILFQRPKVDIMMRHHHLMKFDRMRIRYRSGPHGNSLVWDEGKKTFVLVGRLPLEELVKIARSVN